MAISTLSTQAGLALAVSMMALGASAKPPPNPEFVRPEWLTKPTGEQMAKQFHGAPSCHGDRLFTGGRVVLECDLVVNGRLKNCVVTEEEPWDCAYGEMSLAVTPYFQAKPRLPDGRRLKPGMRVRLPMRYQGPE